MAAAFPQMIEDGIDWMHQHYPDVNFDGYRWELAGGCIKSRHSRGRMRITICPTGYVGFYDRACRQIIGLRRTVGKYAPEMVIMTDIVHELTHAAQYERDYHKGNECDTTINELCWLQEHHPAIYRRCWMSEVPTVRPAPIRAWSKTERLPCYMFSAPLTVTEYQEFLAS
jgi:hypothetical protein